MGQFFSILNRYMPPPCDIGSPDVWASEDFLHLHFDGAASAITTSVKQFYFRYQSPGHWFDVFGSFYGPLVNAIELLDAGAASLLRRESLALIDTLKIASGGTMVVPGDYAQTVILLE